MHDIRADGKLTEAEWEHCLPQWSLLLLQPDIDLPAPNCRNSQHPKPLVAGQCHLHHHRWAWGDHLGGSQATDRVGKLIHDPSPQLCNLDHVVTWHTSYSCTWSTQFPCRLSLNQCCSHLTLRGLFSYLSLTPWSLWPVSALINSSATSNFLDWSLFHLT